MLPVVHGDFDDHNTIFEKVFAKLTVDQENFTDADTFVRV